MSTLAGFYVRSRTVLELATGVGITENISQGYRELCRMYRPGDRIFLFGFSRGAYTARCLAGLIMRCGLLKPENLRFSDDVVQLYRYRDVQQVLDRANVQGDQPLVQGQPGLFHDKRETSIHFMGLWDTVASLGLPLWGWWFRIGRLWTNAGLTDGSASDNIETRPAQTRGTICHALSMDETRAQFFPTPFDLRNPTVTSPHVEQRWFRGAHAGVGGGYADAGLSDISLAWIAERATAHGLLLRPGWCSDLAPEPLARIEREIDRTPAWRFFPTWPRWHPCTRPDTESSEFGTLDESVHVRASHASRNRRGRDADPTVPQHAKPTPLSSDELLFLAINESARIVVDASQPWCRTGLVLEKGAEYEVTYNGESRWRDAQLASTGPEGATRLGWRDVRKYFGGLRRTDSANWMELVFSVAFPRHWPLREYGALRLLSYLFLADPQELTRELVPVGALLSKKKSLRLRMEAENGMLHAFANDVWLGYENNSGAIEITIKRVEASTSESDLTIGKS